MRVRRGRTLIAAVITVVLVAAGVACGGGGGTATPTTRATTGTPATAPSGAATATPGTPAPASPAASTTAAAAVDPCTLRISLEGRPLTPGVAFRLDAQKQWQICLGGVAAGSGEKYLYRTNDAGASWTLISETTLGVMTPEANVGAFPNGNGVAVMLFRDANVGWIGLNSPGQNLFRSTDGGVTWTASTGLPASLPVTAITFSSASDGTLQTPDGPWHTTDGGDHWTAGP